MDRYWMLTWRTYGTWVPGERGFVSEFRDANGNKCLVNTPGVPTADELPDLAAYAAAIMDEDAVVLDLDQAKAMGDQLRETARYRCWWLLALAVMKNHIHLVVGVPGDPDPERLLADFKAWATRRLNHGWGHRQHWWVQSGSRRKKGTPEKIREAVEYVRDQPCQLVVWLDPRVAARLTQPANGGT